MSASAAGLHDSPSGVTSLLAGALARPVRRDVVGIAACTCYQVALMTAAALHPAAGRSPLGGTPQSGSVGELFGHNAGVYGLWLAGALTLGVLPVALASFSSVVAGIAVGSAVSTHGASALAFLGHGLLELPALAIAMWLAVRPVLDLWSARRRSDDAPAQGRELLRSWISLTVLALGLLLLAAVWETSLVPTW